MAAVVLAQAAWLLGGAGLVFLLLAILASVFWLWMLVEAIVNEPTSGEKLLWAVVILFLHLIGALLYFFLRHHRHGTPAT